MTSEFTPLRGKVARILSSRELALNIGSEQGVELDMTFDVLDANGENITDPDTGRVLGSLYRPKIRVKVVQVQEQLSVACTYKTKSMNIGGLGPNLGVWASVFAPPNWIEERESLKTEEATWEDLDERDSFVATGDPVVQIMEDDGDEREEVEQELG